MYIFFLGTLTAEMLRSAVFLSSVRRIPALQLSSCTRSLTTLPALTSNIHWTQSRCPGGNPRYPASHFLLQPTLKRAYAQILITPSSPMLWEGVAGPPGNTEDAAKMINSRSSLLKSSVMFYFGLLDLHLDLKCRRPWFH